MVALDQSAGGARRVFGVLGGPRFDQRKHPIEVDLQHLHATVATADLESDHAVRNRRL